MEVSLFPSFIVLAVSLRGFFSNSFCNALNGAELLVFYENSGRRGKFASVCIPRTVLITGLVEI